MIRFVKRISNIVIVLAAVIAVGTIGFVFLEGLSWFDSFYFTVVTVATVGYGDIYATTTAGRILAMIIIIAGVGAFTGLVVNAAQYIIERQTEKVRWQRLSMLIEMFYSEIGNEMLRILSQADQSFDKGLNNLGDSSHAAHTNNKELRNIVSSHKYDIIEEKIDLIQLKHLLQKKSDLLMRLLENPNLIEHGVFTDILRATFHFRQELIARDVLTDLPNSDLGHLTIDARRIYGITTKEWANHMIYLQKHYPYLYSLQMRMNPFQKNSSPTVK